MRLLRRLRQSIGSAGRGHDDPDLPPHYHHNLAALATDHTSFTASFTFFSPTTVLPTLFRQLTASAPVIGLSSTIFSAGMLLPQLAFARLVTGKPRTKPYMLTGASVRVLLPIIAVALWSGITRTPKVAIAFLLGCFTIFAIGDGLCSLSWLDIMARAIPPSRRGRFVTISHIASSLAGVGVGIVLSTILGSNRVGFPDNYALIFTLSAVAIVPSVIALLSVREPPPEQTASLETYQRRKRGLRVLFSDRTLVRLVVSRVLINMVSLAVPFYVGHAQDVLRLPAGIIGGFVTAETMGGILAILLLGPLAERSGALIVVQVAGAAAIASPALALVLHLVGGGWLSRAYPLVYVAYGIVHSVWLLGFANYAIEIAPQDMRPAYIGLSNTVMGAMAVAPTVGGWLLEASSYTVLFGLATAVAAVGFLVSLSLPSTQRP